MKRLMVLALAASFSAPLHAQDSTVNMDGIDQCRATPAIPSMDCVGLHAQSCYEAYGGGPNMVMSVCLEEETLYWDAALNDAYAHVMGLARKEETNPDGMFYPPEALSSSLRDVQRAWIVYRDAICDFEVALAMPFGSAVGPAANGCLMRETARQVFELERMAREMKQ